MLRDAKASVRARPSRDARQVAPLRAQPPGAVPEPPALIQVQALRMASVEGASALAEQALAPGLAVRGARAARPESQALRAAAARPAERRCARSRAARCARS